MQRPIRLHRDPVRLGIFSPPRRGCPGSSRAGPVGNPIRNWRPPCAAFYDTLKNAPGVIPNASRKAAMKAEVDS